MIFQTGALLEVLHCMIGLVRSSVVTTFMQGERDEPFISRSPFCQTFCSPPLTHLLLWSSCLLNRLLPAFVSLFFFFPFLVMSRIFIVWMVNYLSPDARAHWGSTMCVSAWATVEVIRYVSLLAKCSR